MKWIQKEISDSINITGNLIFALFLIVFVFPPAYIGKKLIHEDKLLIRYISQCVLLLIPSEFDEDDPYAFG